MTSDNNKKQQEPAKERLLARIEQAEREYVIGAYIDGRAFFAAIRENTASSFR